MAEPEEDEEDMFTESVQVQGEVKLVDSTPAITAKHDLSDTIFVFKDDEILINDLKKSSGWFVGDVLNSMRVPDFCSIAKVTPDEHKTTSFDGMLTGGHMYGYPQSQAFGFEFVCDSVNAVDTINMSANLSLPALLVPRYMHQSCIVKGKSGFWQLMVLGGKASRETWLNSVHKLDLLPYFRPGTMVKDSKGAFVQASSSWEACKPMSSGRANFALTVCKNTVFVFGGIQSGSKTSELHVPKLCSHLIEKYMPQEDLWMTVEIKNAPSLAAFSWCKVGDSLLILGGSDGSLLTSEMFQLDLIEETCAYHRTDFDFSTGMGHLVFREKANQLQHIGGFNSYGVNYSMQMGGKHWEELQSQHSNVTASQELELTANTSVYYP